MCGIVGYVGRAQAAPILLDGLRRLEYRGYDSAGVAIVNGDHVETRKCAGRIAALAKLVSQKPAAGSYGISHTRWATHGKVNDENAHPHFDATGKVENFLASDVSAIVAYTRDAVYLNDFDLVAVERDKFEISSIDGAVGEHAVSKVEFSAEDIKKGDYPHYMLKEICEQPDSVRDAMRGRLTYEECTAKLGGLNMNPAELRDVARVVLTGCGTALHAGRVGEYIVEQLASIPVEVEFASEYRHRNTPPTKHTLVFAISQSGETADTLGALRESKRKGYRTLGICNNVASTIARESDGGVYMHAGPEIGVAATKSFTSQLIILNLIGLLLGRMRQLSTAQGKRIIDALESLPAKIEQALKLSDHVKSIAKKYVDVSGMMFFGRQFNYPIALEGALKMKEITYLFAEGHPSAELKHGIIALVRPDLPSIFIAPDDAVFSKNLNNIDQVKARKGPIIAVTSGNGASQLKDLAADIIEVPTTIDCLSPVLTVIPLQLLAYHLAVALGRDVDKPRNLAKIDTVT